MEPDTAALLQDLQRARAAPDPNGTERSTFVGLALDRLGASSMEGKGARQLKKRLQVWYDNHKDDLPKIAVTAADSARIPPRQLGFFEIRSRERAIRRLDELAQIRTELEWREIARQRLADASAEVLGHKPKKVKRSPYFDELDRLEENQREVLRR